ncbi:MAG: hypothetical protein SA339_08815 [Methanomassiliicoccus sp.]|nr:hypothetical protein [Methanomassiliicoccus sp.]
MVFGAFAALMVAGVAIVLMSGNASALGYGATGEWNGDLDHIRDQVQDQTCDPDRIMAQDGSCLDPTVDQDATCDQDHIQDQEKLQDGSCQDLTCDQDQTRDKVRACW